MEIDPETDAYSDQERSRRETDETAECAAESGVVAETESTGAKGKSNSRAERESDDGAERVPGTGTEPESDSNSGHVSRTSANPDPETVTFGWEGIRTGFLTCLPVALGVGGYGIAFGVLANQAGLSVAEAALMSATVVAGASQIVAVELWADPIPIAAVLVTTFAINLRYSLMGAALQPWFKHLSAAKVYGSLFVMADENWALTMRNLRSGAGYGAFLLGSGFAVWLFWVSATVIGAVAGGVVGDPTEYGFDFILAAVFLALAAELWEGKSSLVPWTVALAVAIVAAELVPGRWYILLGGLAAAAVEVIRYDQ
ncbi:ABC-type transport system permease protein [Natrialba magadii ATCC 43099]|uniref:ABC-type transport system permease protein n=1 Tax=Natrialba magadii (strain ATCC 43099 / DSM 3394 / CCM 3739 / CIP 104546 / IAM 13178 / JCM 8861 / NBRC 102185 / NCIMB 2190 / MS3) TaxID=547559 RepID=D3SZ33_NATMM|nr:AzlC family ABC transporter permease [Natrialba magadii]ADD06225.1 ABC-type transport system permease protein [Natrialba magadii ATCC 43099]ELY31060.1 AzlC family protein [Natrialba magadii ATCC 43099]